MAEADFDKKVLHQVEHYFGDANLRRDKWLQEEISKDKDGYVSLEKVCAFNKMKDLGATDVAKVAEILKDKSEVVEINEEGTMLKRKLPLNLSQDYLDRTVYAKGFPDTMTLDELQTFWSGHGDVALVQMRRIGKSFKGSVLVELKTKEAADAIVAKNGEIKYNDTTLEIASYEQWNNEKMSATQKRKEEEKSRKRKTDEERQQKAEADRKEYLASLESREIPQGVVLKAEGMPEGTKREQLAEHFKPFGDIKFIEFRIGQPAAFVRFDKPIEGSLDKIKESKFQEEHTLTCSLLGGDELKQYWLNLWTLQYDKQHNPANNNNNYGKFNRHGGRGGHFNKRQRT